MAKYALVGCKLIDGIHPGIKSGMTILVDGGKLLAIGPAGEIAVPPEYRSIPLDGKTIMPGLINAHVHLLASDKPMKAIAAGKSQDRLLRFLHTGLGKSIIDGMVKSHVQAALQSGVTTLRCVGDLLYSDVKLRDHIAAGKVQGPRLLVSGPVITPTGGHGQAFSIICDSPWEVRKAVRKNAHEQVDLIKICSTGGVTDARKLGEAGRPTMTAEEIAAACEEAHKAGLLVASHTQSLQGVKTALECGVDTIEHGSPLDDELIELFLHNPRSLRGYSCMVPTLYPAIAIGKLSGSVTHMKPVNIQNSEIIYEGMVEGLRRAMAAGIKVGMGTDASCPFVTHYNTWRELDFLVRYAGLTPEQAIQNATRVNAEILGIEDRTGTLEKGKAADLIVLENNPLEDVRALAGVSMVMAGELFIEKPAVKPYPEVEAALNSIK